MSEPFAKSVSPNLELGNLSPGRLSRFTVPVLLCLTFLYCIVLIPLNLVGSRDEEMLNMAAGNSDTQQMYAVIMGMQEPVGTWKEGLYNWVHYDWYFYGYPFFLVSALATLPVKWLIAHGLVSPDHAVTANILAIRELSCVYLALAAALLVHAWTGFRSFFAAVLVFLFLILVPNNFTFPATVHPEPMMTLFVVLTILALAKDNVNFGRFFYVAALLCGFAVGVKFTALFFGPCVLVYLVLGTFARRYGWFADDPGNSAVAARPLLALVRHGAVFVVLMVAGFILANPLVMRSSAIALDYFEKAKLSIFCSTENARLIALMNNGEATDNFTTFTDTFVHNVGHWWIPTILVAISVFSIAVDRSKRLLNIIILAWCLPLAAFLFYRSSTERLYYLMSAIVPLWSCAANPSIWRFWRLPKKSIQVLGCVLLLALLVAGAAESAAYIEQNQKMAIDIFNQERVPWVTTGEEIDRLFLAKVPADGKYRILKDWDVGVCYTVYIPNNKRFHVTDFMATGTYRELRKNHPDLLILVNSNIEFFAKPESLDYFAKYTEDQLLLYLHHPSPPLSHEFYRDAQTDQLRGYRRVWHNDLVTVFEKQPNGG